MHPRRYHRTASLVTARLPWRPSSVCQVPPCLSVCQLPVSLMSPQTGISSALGPDASDRYSLFVCSRQSLSVRSCRVPGDFICLTQTDSSSRLFGHLGQVIQYPDGSRQLFVQLQPFQKHPVRPAVADRSPLSRLR